MIYIFTAAVCSRAMFGPDVWLRLVFYLDWVFARLDQDRDEIGNMIRQRRTRYTVFYLALASSGLTWLAFYTLDTDLHWIQLATGIATVVDMYQKLNFKPMKVLLTNKRIKNSFDFRLGSQVVVGSGEC